MDAETLKLAVFAEQLAVLLAKSIADLHSVLHGSNEKPVSEILDDADTTYKGIIERAKA